MGADWGELSEEDVAENELSLREGFRLLSAYRTAKGQKIYVTWNKDRVGCVLGFSVFLFIYLIVEAVGTVGNSTFFVEFSKRCGNGGKTRFVSMVSIARQFPQPVVNSRLAHALPILF